MIKYFLLLLLSISAFAVTIPDPFPDESVKYATMPNGLRVVVKENHAAPIVAVSVVVSAGSGISDSKGIPHYLEHLSFQGTQKYPVPLSAQYLIEEKGGYCTGTTNRDSTRFEGVITADKIDLMLSVLSQVTLHPILSDEAFERERPTILAEIQRYYDDPEVNLLNSAYYFAYRNHPYCNPTTGTIQNVLMLKGEEIRDFHKRWYKPGNMSLVVVGDVKTETVLDAAEKYFTTNEKSFIPAPIIKVQPQDCKQISSVLPTDTEVWQAIALPTSAANDFSGCSTADILITMLTTGNNALVYKWLKDTNITVISTGGEYITSNYAGRIIIWIHTAKKDADTAKKILLAGLLALS
ncbi:MAG: pitrilysin family protein, partial [bacterium]